MTHPRNLHIAIGSAAFALLAVLSAISAERLATESMVIATPQRTRKWVTVVEAQMGSGATIQPATHTFFQIPASVGYIKREVLLGGRGNSVRYWGYCFPGEEDSDYNPPQGTVFPGKIFLSEAERAYRYQQEARLYSFAPLRSAADQPKNISSKAIRHQIDQFHGGTTCYIMSEQVLPIGIDADNDGLNSQLENNYVTDSDDADTDGDGLTDGTEILVSNTNPKVRDSDMDGIPDGLEDTNRNGRVEIGETSPLNRDSDHDGLCDGYCREYETKRVCGDNKSTTCSEIPYGLMIGEDRNLNGLVDTGESDPRKSDSTGDGISDLEEFYRCMLRKDKNC